MSVRDTPRQLLSDFAPSLPRALPLGYTSHDGLVADHWVFFQDKRSMWRWRHVEPDTGITTQCVSGYMGRNDCIADAMRHGYLSGSGPVSSEFHVR